MYIVITDAAVAVSCVLHSSYTIMHKIKIRVKVIMIPPTVYRTVSNEREKFRFGEVFYSKLNTTGTQKKDVSFWIYGKYRTLP